jgi:peptidoglycan hydrolase FlgJ
MSIGNLNQQLALDVQGLDRVRRSAAEDPQRALQNAAAQFEALFLHQMLKSMRDATPRADLMDSASLRFHEALLDQQLSVHLAGRGTGLAEQLVRQLSGDARVAAPKPLWGAAPANRAETGQGSAGFVERLAPAAQAAAARTGVPAKLIIAQAALETGWGQHEIRTADGRNSHNLFGIKAGSDWRGETTQVVTHEYVNGERVRVTDHFRVYDSLEAALTDHGRLLTQHERYAGVRTAADDMAAARALQDGGYATDPAYADKLIAVMRGIHLPEAENSLAALK